MDTFSNNIKNQNKEFKQELNNTLYKSDMFNVIKKGDNEFIQDQDEMKCIVYIKDESYILMKRIMIDSWNHRLNQNNSYITPISFKIKNNQNILNELRQELYENVGIILNEFYQFDIEGPFHKDNHTTSHIYSCIIDIDYKDYKMVASPNQNKLNTTCKININDIDNLKINDLTTHYIFYKLKNEFLK